MGYAPAHFINFLIYLGTALPLLILGMAIFMISTPYNEMHLLRDGACQGEKSCAAQAAAYDLGGKLLGLSLVLASAIFHSAKLGDLIVWGLVGIGFQVAMYYLLEVCTPFKIRTEIPNGNVAVGVFSSWVSVGTGLIMAALIS